VIPDPRLHCSALLFCMAAVCLPAGEGSKAANDDTKAKKLAQIVENQKKHSLIFFVANGKPNACGRNCDQWIAAEGKFDPDAWRRFKEFLANLPRRDFPVFFNSSGGSSDAATQIGTALREYRMTVAVGHTIPEGCDHASPASATCRRLMQTKPEHRARLVMEDAQCSSACVLAIAGGSFRRVGRGARIGIHAARDDVPLAASVDKIYASMKRYLLQMGVEPGIIDAGAKTPGDSIHYVSRQEIARFGIETVGPFETSWLTHQDSAGRVEVFKAWTQSKAPESTSYRTAVIRATCGVMGTAWLSIRRELDTNKVTSTTAIYYIAAGQTNFRLDAGAAEAGIGAWHINTTFALLEQAAASPQIEIFQAQSLQTEQQVSVTKLSTTGLLDALQKLRTYCLAPLTARPSPWTNPWR
jgi:hypothetical protein